MATDPTRFAIPRVAVRPMMYGFGDAKEQDPETVELMEEIVLDYIADTVCCESQNAEKKEKMIDGESMGQVVD